MKKFKKTLIVALAAAMAAGAAACSDAGEASKVDLSSSSSQRSSEPEQSSEAEMTEEETTEAADEDTVGKVGDTLENDGLKITLVDAKRYDSIEYSEYFSDEPDEGNEYVVYFFEAENTSDEDNYINMFYTSISVDDYSIEETMLVSNPEGYDSFSGDIMAGKKLKGYIAIEPEKGWKTSTVVYKDGGLANSPSFTFEVKSSDVD